MLNTTTAVKIVREFGTPDQAATGLRYYNLLCMGFGAVSKLYERELNKLAETVRASNLTEIISKAYSI